MVPHRDVMKVSEAQERINSYIIQCKIEEISLEESYGRRLAVQIIAANDMPHFPRSGMDGYAIQSMDSSGATPQTPISLQVIEEIPCGTVPTKQVTRGTAARIMTGAHIPDGADAVIMLELTDSSSGQVAAGVRIMKEMQPGDNITPIGLEIRQGQLLLRNGVKIGPGEIALLASYGYAKVKVYKQPQVAIFATGSELLDIDKPLVPGKIRNSNGYMIAAQVQAAGGIPLLMGSIHDLVGQAKDIILESFSSADMIITTGGVSVGDYDIMVDIFKQWDGKMLFNKLAMRPGSPTTAGIWQDKFLFALSGNPGACFVGFQLFVEPVLRGAQGGHETPPLEFEAFLGVDYPKGNAYTRYVRGTSYIDRGQISVSPTGTDKSSIMTSIKDSDCLIVLPPRGRGYKAGELVSAVSLIYCSEDKRV